MGKSKDFIVLLHHHGSYQVAETDKTTTCYVEIIKLKHIQPEITIFDGRIEGFCYLHLESSYPMISTWLADLETDLCTMHCVKNEMSQVSFSRKSQWQCWKIWMLHIIPDLVSWSQDLETDMSMICFVKIISKTDVRI